MCAVLPFDFDIFPPPALDQTNSKTTPYVGLLTGFPFVFVLFLSLLTPLLPCFSPMSPTFPFFSLFFSIFFVITGVDEEVSVKKTKVSVDTSGLVPYGGDSSDEEDERTHSSKTENL